MLLRGHGLGAHALDECAQLLDFRGLELRERRAHRSRAVADVRVVACPHVMRRVANEAYA